MLQGAAAATPDSPDASASASSTGTALCPSQPDNFGSYDPRFPLYLPERVVDILSDGQDGYKFIGGRNGIYAFMALNVDNAVPATLQVLLRGEGIVSAKNWCARSRAIYLYTAKGSPVRIVEGRRRRSIVRGSGPAPDAELGSGRHGASPASPGWAAPLCT
jgi:hypothetical protein